YARAEAVASHAQKKGLVKAAFTFDRRLDQLLTSRLLGFPLMLLILGVVFWLTIEGANVPSSMLATLLVDQGHSWLKALSASAGLPWWLDGFMLDGVYLATAWVISVMLP
ncbi:MAG TPA: iron transporter FeoB, partial [Gemmatimonadetes bacterium]|nr:iron transporter FeoB [Gemmatimonadota bacterium]